MGFGTQKSSVGPENRGNYELGVIRAKSDHGLLLRSDLSLRFIN